MRQLVLLFSLVCAASVFANHLGGGVVELLVVHDAGNTVPSAPYLAKITDAVAKKESALAEARVRLSKMETDRAIAERDLFPITTQMTVASPQRKHVLGLTAPLFVIGMDSVSLRWLEQEFARLKARGALGIVVEAPDFDQFQALRARLLAEGVWLDVGKGDAIARGYQIDTYPYELDTP